jgi:hypothetical protein
MTWRDQEQFSRKVRSRRDEHANPAGNLRRPPLGRALPAAEAGRLGLDLPGRPDPVLCVDPLLSDGRGLLSVDDGLEPDEACGFVGLANFQRLWADVRCSGRSSATPCSISSIGTPVSLVLSFTIAYYLDRVTLPARLHPGAVFPALPDDGRGDGLGLALVLPAGPHRHDQRHSLEARHAAAALPALDQPGPALDHGDRRSGRASASRSSSSWPACAPSRTPITRPRASTALGEGRSCARSRFPC